MATINVENRELRISDVVEKIKGIQGIIQTIGEELNGVREAFDEIKKIKGLKKIKETITELKEINKQQEARIQNLETKAMQLTNLHFVFQGVIFTAVTTKDLKHEHRLIAFLLSLIATLLNAPAFFIFGLYVIRCSKELDQNRSDLSGYIAQDQVGTSNPFARHKITWRSQTVPLMIFVLSFLLFLGFSGVILCGCYVILP